MVKRAKSPSLPDDAKYLVVHQPYPLNAHFELAGDYIAFAFWAATVVGSTAPIWGIHHKPKARSTVILEIDKNVPEAALKGLLGEHRWSEVLKDPREDEKERVSKVFFCLYRTQRAAQKDGWKRVQVEQEWFVEKGWNLSGGPFKSPYPDTHWCPPLAEDPTNKNIARPLPASMKAPPPAEPALVPGSSQWVEAVQAGKPTVDENAKAWRGGAKRKGAGNNRGRPAGQKIAEQASPSAVGPSGTASMSKTAWSRISSTSGSASAISTGTSTPSSAPPGLSVQAPNAPPGLTRTVPLSPPGLTKVQQSLSSMTFSDSDDEEEVGPSVSMRFEDEDSDDELDAAFSATSYQYTPPSDDSEPSGSAPVNLWAQLEQQSAPQEDAEPMCEVHGKLCPKGICLAHKERLREQRKAQEAADREKKKEEAKERKKAKKKEKGKGEDGLTVPSKNTFRRKREAVV